jgi:hypothetical protein
VRMTGARAAECWCSHLKPGTNATAHSPVADYGRQSKIDLQPQAALLAAAARSCARAHLTL